MRFSILKTAGVVFAVSAVALLAACSGGGMRSVVGPPGLAQRGPIALAHTRPDICGWVTQDLATYTSGFAQLLGISAISAKNVWAVGVYNPSPTGAPQLLAEKWNGTAWVTTFPPQRNSSAHILYSTAPISATKQWAVGANAQTANAKLDQTLVEKWNGTAWAIVASPNVNPTKDSNDLFSVHAWGSTAAMAVGQTRVTATGAFRTLALQWNGAKWVLVKSPNIGTVTSFFNGVGGIAANDAWAVGAAYKNGKYLPMSAHWNGSAWSLQPVPAPHGTSGLTILYSVSAVATNDVWTVGYDLSGSGAAVTVAYHWNGSAWTQDPTPNVGGSANDYFYSVTNTSTNDIWAAGEYEMTTGGSFSTLVAHRTGSGWTIETTQNPSPNGNGFFGIAALNPTNVWAAGAQGSTSTLVEAYCR